MTIDSPYRLYLFPSRIGGPIPIISTPYPNVCLRSRLLRSLPEWVSPVPIVSAPYPNGYPRSPLSPLPSPYPNGCLRPGEVGQQESGWRQHQALGERARAAGRQQGEDGAGDQSADGRVG